MILDATAGNRLMWLHKNSPNIVYLDIEKRLKVKPTIYADSRCLPFRPGAFHTIFFDPPHMWREGAGIPCYSIPYGRKFAKLMGITGLSYYGSEKYKTRLDLIRYIYQSQVEFYRVLKADGLLWFKWNESRIPLNRIVTLFLDWRELMRIWVKSPSQTLGKHQTYWVCMEKSGAAGEQAILSKFVLDDQ